MLNAVLTSSLTPSLVLMRRKLPIGIQTFRKIREEEYYYVDKIGLAIDLIEQGCSDFLRKLAPSMPAAASSRCAKSN